MVSFRVGSVRTEELRRCQRLHNRPSRGTRSLSQSFVLPNDFGVSRNAERLIHSPAADPERLFRQTRAAAAFRVQRRFGGGPPDRSGIERTESMRAATCTQATAVCTSCAYNGRIPAPSQPDEVGMSRTDVTREQAPRRVGS